MQPALQEGLLANTDSAATCPALCAVVIPAGIQYQCVSHISMYDARGHIIWFVRSMVGLTWHYDQWVGKGTGMSNTGGFRLGVWGVHVQH